MTGYGQASQVIQTRQAAGTVTTTVSDIQRRVLTAQDPYPYSGSDKQFAVQKQFLECPVVTGMDPHPKSMG